MLYSQKSIAVITSALVAIGLGTQVLAQGTAPHATIGVVDRDKVVTAYPKAQQAAEELKKEEDKVHKLIEDSNKQYDDAKNAHKPPAELEGLQRRLQTQIDDQVKKVQARAQALEAQLEGEIDSAIKAEASANKVETVLLKPAVLMGGVDLTAGVVKRLAPVATSTSKPSATK